MIAPALVDGRPLSHPDLDRAWAAFIEHDVAPVFHVANQQRPFDEAWYASDPEPTNPVLSSVFLWVPAALAISDLVVNGVLERRPQLRLGVIELSAVWLPMFLQKGRGYSESDALFFNSVYFVATDIGCIGAGAASGLSARASIFTELPRGLASQALRTISVSAARNRVASVQTGGSFSCTSMTRRPR